MPGSPALAPATAEPAEREGVAETGAASQQQRAYEALLLVDRERRAHAPHDRTHALRRGS